MKTDNSDYLRYGMLIPLALLLASFVTGCLSYSNAKQIIAEDLNDAMLALANENSGLWTRQDTIAALRQMHETTHKPIIYQASDVNFRNSALKDEAYFTLSLIDKKMPCLKSTETEFMRGMRQAGLPPTPSCSYLNVLRMVLPYSCKALSTAPWHQCLLLPTRHCPVFFSRYPFSRLRPCLYGEEKKTDSLR